MIATEDDIDIKSIAPDLDKRCTPIINGYVDIIGLIITEWDGEGNNKRWLITKSTPTIEAGSRWKYLAPKIPFGYKYLENAIAEAIDKAEIEGAKVVDKVER